MGLQNIRRDIPALPFCKINLKGSKPLPPAYAKVLYTLGDYIRKRRLDLKLQQIEVAEIIGVDEVSIYNWEKNRTSPHVQHIPNIIEFLGGVPTNVQPESLSEKILYHRKLKGLSQEKLARYIGVDPGTLANWENGTRQPLKRFMDNIEKFFASFTNLTI